jgi:hypothetical protein
MTYTLSTPRWKKPVVVKSFAGMVLWVSAPKWQWLIGREPVETLRDYAELWNLQYPQRGRLSLRISE